MTAQRFASPESFKQSLDERIRQTCRAQGSDASRFRQLLIFDRFLARLSVALGERVIVSKRRVRSSTQCSATRVVCGRLRPGRGARSLGHHPLHAAPAQAPRHQARSHAPSIDDQACWQSPRSAEI